MNEYIISLLIEKTRNKRSKIETTSRKKKSLAGSFFKEDYLKVAWELLYRNSSRYKRVIHVKYFEK